MKLEDNVEEYFQINPYQYCVNNPLKYVDMDGNKGIAVMRGNNYIIKENQYKYYPVDIYPDLTLKDYYEAKQSGRFKTFVPEATVYLSRDALATVVRNDVYGSFRGEGEFGENKESPNVLYIMWAETTKTNRINLTTEKWGNVYSNGSNGEKRSYLQIHSWDPSYSKGCLTTGFLPNPNKEYQIDYHIQTLFKHMPDITNQNDPAYLDKMPTSREKLK